MSTTNSTFEFWNAFDSFMRYYNDIFDFKVGFIEFSDDLLFDVYLFKIDRDLLWLHNMIISLLNWIPPDWRNPVKIYLH